MSWRYGTWAVEHPLPVGCSQRVDVGATVRAGDIVASGAIVGDVHVVIGARRLGVAPGDLELVSRVRPVALVSRGTVLARTGRRSARAVTSPIEGRLVHVTADGDFSIAPPLAPWVVRSTMDGRVVRSDAAAVSVEGRSWALSGIAAYGPDAIGEIALGVDGAGEALAPSRIDVRLRGRIVVGGARMAAEAITRAHACGVAGLVAGAAPAGGLRVVYGDDVDARGRSSFDDQPSVLCLVGFGSAPLPREVFGPLVAFAGARAALHVASARLFVFAEASAAVAATAPVLALADDHGSVRPLEAAPAPAATMRFASEVTCDAVEADGTLVPAPNVLPFDADR